MPFQKGNTLWRDSLKSRKENKEKIDSFLQTIAGGGMTRYAEIMDKLSDGEPLAKAEEQYLDRMDSWREYVRPKLARTDNKNTHEGELTFKVVKYTDGD